MTTRIVRFGGDAREALQAGLDVLADAVKVTLGPAGRNVGLSRRLGSPLIVNDGVTVAREIDLADSFASMGARLIRQAAEKAEERTGDGTTTATVLAQAIVHEGFRNVAAGADPMAMRRGLVRARAAVDEAITAAAIPVAGLQATVAVASISASNPDMGRLIGDVMHHVGRDGAVSVEESQCGVALLSGEAALDALHLDGDEAVGARCLHKALSQPMRQIAENAGYEGSLVVETVRRRRRSGRRPNLGFDAVSGRYVDMVKAGIVDPAKVVHASLDAAVSTAAMLLTMEAALAEAEPDGTATPA